MNASDLLRLVPLVPVLGCATQAERAPDGSAPVEAAAVATPPASIRAGDSKTLDSAMAALVAKGSECGPAPEEPGIRICDAGRNGHVTLIMLHQDPRVFLISHILKADGLDCNAAAPKLNEINAGFDNLTIVCAENITFRAPVTLGEAGLTDEEFFRYVDEFRKEIQTIIRAGALKGIVKD